MINPRLVTLSTAQLDLIGWMVTRDERLNDLFRHSDPRIALLLDHMTGSELLVCEFWAEEIRTTAAGYSSEWVEAHLDALDQGARRLFTELSFRLIEAWA